MELFWALEDLEGAHVISAREAAVGRVAGWFHDAVYDTTTAAGDNEIHSAELAVRDLTALRLRRRRPGARSATSSSPPRPTSWPTKGLPAAFHDADLWILSRADAARYDEYTVQVREEYAAVPDERVHVRAGRRSCGRSSTVSRSMRRRSRGSAGRTRPALNLAPELETLTGPDRLDRA